jgi:signal transduction histidine kinase
MTELVPVRIKNEGLLRSIQNLIDEKLFLKDLKVDLNIEGDHQLSATEEQGLFRIIQEALNNIVKHAQTNRVHIHLHLINPLWVEVEDEGCGFELQKNGPATGIGLSSMRERANEIGWELVIESSPGLGTRILVQKTINSMEVG